MSDFYQISFICGKNQRFPNIEKTKPGFYGNRFRQGQQ
jgi:hypothetical protein